MADKTKIEWTDTSWNPIVGCSIKSPGCKICYAMKDAWRKNFNPKTPQYHGLTEKVNGKPVWTGEVRFVEHKLLEPLSWRKPRMIFVNSMSDLFHEDVPDEWIDKIFAVMAMCPQHTFQILTKRPERMRDYLAGHRESSGQFYAGFRDALIEGMAQKIHHDRTGEDPSMWLDVQLPLKNVWLGFSAEDQKRFDERWEHMKSVAAAGWLVWCSAEPLLGPIDATAALPNRDDIIHVRHHPDNVPSPQLDRLTDAVKGEFRRRLSLDWMVVGGESGPSARPMHPHWVEQIQWDCNSAGVPFLFKQWGDWVPALQFPRGIEDDPVQSCFKSVVWNGAGWDETNGAWDDNEQWSIAQSGVEPEQQMFLVGKKLAGRMLDGVIHNAFPESLAA